MAPHDEPAASAERDLVLTRIIDAPRDKVYRAGTKPEPLKQWSAPLPWTTSVAEAEVRPGGSSPIVMRSPEGRESPSRGGYLEVAEHERLVLTDANTRAWEPSERPFTTVVLPFEEEGREEEVHRPGTPLDGGGSRAARGDGVLPRVGTVHRPARGSRGTAVSGGAGDPCASPCGCGAACGGMDRAAAPARLRH